MRKLTKKISMLMVLAMLVGLFSGVVSASAASAWSFKSGKYNVAVGGEINMKKNEYADFDLLKDGKAPEGYTVVWESSDEDVVWVNAKTGQLRADKAKKAEDGDKADISATFTNTKTKKSATRSFTIVVGEVKAPVYTVEQADVTAVLGDAIKFAPVVKNEAGEVVKFATHKSYNGYFLDGKAITNPWTPEAAGEYTVTVAQFASKADVADLAKAVRKIDVKVTVKADLAAEATGVKEITVYGDFAKDAKFAVKKDAKQNVSFTVTVAEDGKSATLALTNRITKGTYTVAYGDAKVDLALEDEKAASIVIAEKDGQIFTSSDKKEAYIHYDVFNQYGESVRKTFEVEWSHNADKDKESDDKINGILTLKKATEFDYNDVIVLTGVVSGYGFAVSETANMTIGLERNVSSVKVLGLVKGDSTELVQEISAGFTGAYWIVFEMYDRAGYVIKYKNADTVIEDLKFISLNPLLAEVYEDDVTGKPEIEQIYIDGVAYGKILVVPGRTEQVKKGGVAEITITSTKTGVNTPYSLRVVSEQILDEFRIIAPESIIAKTNPWGGTTEEFELAYEAIDTEGNAITDFRALYKAVSFGDDDLVLEERNDGTARLHYTANGVKSGIDYDTPVVLTAIVKGTGKSSSLTINVKPQREATSVAGMVEQNGGNAYVLEGNQINIDLIDNAWAGRPLCIQFNDQYDEMIKAAGVMGSASNLEDSVYLAVRLIEEDSTDFTFSGAPANYLDDKKTEDKADDEYTKAVTYTDNDNNSKNDYQLFGWYKPLTLTASSDVTSTQKSVVVEFALADAEGKLISGSDKTATFYIVDISKCVDFTANPGWPESDALINYASPIGYEVKAVLANGKTIPVVNAVSGNYAIKYEVGPQYSAATITPATGSGFSVSGSALQADRTKFEDNSGIKNADGSYKKVLLTYKVVTKVLVGDKVKAEMENLFQIGDDGEWAVAINTKNHSMGKHSWAKENTDGIVRAKNGIITVDDLMVFIDKSVDNWGKDRGKGNIKVAVTKLVDGGKGIYEGGPILGRGEVTIDDKTVNAIIENAEIGDTFVATYSDGGCKFVINMTVGADQNAKFSDDKVDLNWR